MRTNRSLLPSLCLTEPLIGLSIGQNLQQTRCFQIEQQIPKAVLQSGISTPNDGSSHTSDAAQEIRSDHETLLHTTHDSTATTYMSPAIAARLRESPSQSFDNATNQITGANPRDGSGSSDMRDILNVHDTLQPILSMQGCGSIHGQAQIDTANMVNARDILQPILPAYNFPSFDGQTHGEMVNVYDTLQPILSMQGCSSVNGQAPIDTANMVNVHDMVQPIPPAQAMTSPNGHSQSNAVEMAELHDMFQSIPPEQAARPVANQLPIQDHYCQVMRAQSPAYGQFTLPISAL